MVIFKKVLYLLSFIFIEKREGHSIPPMIKLHNKFSKNQHPWQLTMFISGFWVFEVKSSAFTPPSNCSFSCSVSFSSLSASFSSLTSFSV